MSERDNLEKNENLVKIFGDNRASNTLKLFTKMDKYSTKNAYDLVAIQRNTEKYNSYDTEIKKLVAIQRELEKDSVEFNEIEERKDKLFNERGEALKNIIVYQGVVIAPFNVSGFNAYLDENNHYLIKQEINGIEKPFARMLPSVMIEGDRHYKDILIFLFILASKNGKTFVITYKELREGFNLVSKSDYDNFMKAFKRTLNQLQKTYYIDKSENPLITSYPTKKEKGFEITFNSELFEFLNNDRTLSEINPYVLKMGLSENQISLFFSITRAINVNRFKDNSNFTYRFTRKTLLEWGGYKQDKDFDSGKYGENARKNKSKEHKKLLKDLEKITILYKEFLDTDKDLMKEGLLLISDYNSKTTSFTIVDFYENDLSDTEQRFIKYCKVNSTPYESN